MFSKTLDVISLRLYQKMFPFITILEKLIFHIQTTCETSGMGIQQEDGVGFEQYYAI